MEGNKNIFSLENPVSCFCQITKFKLSHRAMDIQLIEEEKFLIFVGVIYFQGPIQWKGANFTVGVESDMLSLLRRVYPLLIQSPDNLLIELYKLYQVVDTEFNILILAHNGIKSDIPSGY
jgi:hypothetical protein